MGEAMNDQTSGAFTTGPTSNDHVSEYPLGNKRKPVDESFERLFGYKWGTEFNIDADSKHSESSGVKTLINIFGATKTARLLHIVSTGKRRKVEIQPNQVAKSAEKTPEITLLDTAVASSQDDKEMKGVTASLTPTAPSSAATTTVATMAATTKQPPNPKAATAAAGNIDNVLAQLAGPNKVNTVQKTSQDWESFKESDQQLQEALEKKAQSKDAYLVKKDFMGRVDNRRFEIEREERDRERAKRATSKP